MPGELTTMNRIKATPQTILQGKGYFIWKIRYCEGGDVNAIADLAVESQFTHAIIKVANGSRTYNIHPQTGEDLVGPMVKALRNKDISPWGWQYIYGYDPIAEADKAVQRVKQFNLAGFVIDAEAEYKAPGMERKARQYMNRLRSGLPNTPLALSSYRFPSYHPQLPWDAFLDKCDLAMPQVYWEQSYNPASQLERCVNEYQEQTHSRPVIPTGSAYKRGDWQATPEHVIEFMDKAIELDIPAVNYWEWAHTRKHLPETWDAVRDYYWPVEEKEDIAALYISALNTHDPEKVLALYDDDAVHVTSKRTIQGKQAIREWYQEFFREILPNGVFYLTNSIGAKSLRFINWTANSSAGEVNISSDTLSLYHGKIMYHYSFFIVT